MAKYSDIEIDILFKQFLDEVYGEVQIAGYTFDTSTALKELDPIAYRTGLYDWLDTTECDDCNNAFDTCECEE